MMNMKNSKSQIKTWVESLPNRVNHVENSQGWKSGLEVEELDHSLKVIEKSKKNKKIMNEKWEGFGTPWKYLTFELWT